MALPPAPTSLTDESGAPRFGTYQGALSAVDLGRLQGPYALSPLSRLARHKRWLYSFVATREVALLSAVVDVGYSANAFAMAVDLGTGAVLHDVSALGLPPMVSVSLAPDDGVEARFRSPGLSVRAARPQGADRLAVAVRAGRPVRPGLSVAAELLCAGAPPPLTVVAPVENHGVNVTMKRAGLLSFGELTAGGKRYVLDGGVGGFDYTRGHLARHTAWRWAFGCGRLSDGTPVGFNLVQGFNETRADVNENALWVGGKLHPLGRARFTWRKDEVLDPWAVETDDGVLKLAFKPLAAHREERNLGLVKSHFVQPVGLFDGTVTLDGVSRPLSKIPGVTEDQDVLW